MRKLQLSLIIIGCLALGGALGYKMALVRVHHRLERNKELVRRSHAEVWSNPNLEAAAKTARELYAPNFIAHDWTGDDASGVSGVLKALSGERADFPDWSEHVEAMAAEGDLVVTRFVSTGTQARELSAIPQHSPAIPHHGKSLRMPEMEMFRIVDGKLAEQWDLGDIWGANMQLGLFDPDHWSESICGSFQPSHKDRAPNGVRVR